MKINQSNIAMSSSRTYQKTSSSLFKSSITVGRNSQKGSVTLNLSDQASQSKQSGLMLGMRKKLSLLDLSTQNTSEVENTTANPSSKEDANIKILKKLLELLKLLREGKNPYELTSDPLSFQTPDFRSVGNASTNAGTVWTRQTTAESYFHEEEATSFSATGSVVTSDGRNISFNVQLELSRSFTEETSLITEETVSMLTDPLVINMDVSSAEVTDQKFLFDIDCDGTRDEISFVGEGSGFLALDKNGDGTINDGSELFGTTSQDGFRDLAAYDSDDNGWIDENDDIFSKLRIWTKDKDGNDKLITLKQGNVGAIYLGSAKTDFSLNNSETNQQNGQIRKTGIYLKETGEAATIQHVDLAL